MRTWLDGKGALITDEQLLRHLAYFGSLEDALKAGNVTLVSNGEEAAPAREACRPRATEVRLSDFLRDEGKGDCIGA